MAALWFLVLWDLPSVLTKLQSMQIIWLIKWLGNAKMQQADGHTNGWSENLEYKINEVHKTFDFIICFYYFSCINFSWYFCYGQWSSVSSLSFLFKFVERSYRNLKFCCCIITKRLYFIMCLGNCFTLVWFWIQLFEKGSQWSWKGSKWCWNGANCPWWRSWDMQRKNEFGCTNEGFNSSFLVTGSFKI